MLAAVALTMPHPFKPVGPITAPTMRQNHYNRATFAQSLYLTCTKRPKAMTSHGAINLAYYDAYYDAAFVPYAAGKARK